MQLAGVPRGHFSLKVLDLPLVLAALILHVAGKRGCRADKFEDFIL